MKTSFLPLLVLLAMFTFAACQQDDVRPAKDVPHMTGQDLAAFNAKMELLPEKTEATLSSRVPINYVTTLGSGNFAYTHVTDSDVGDITTHDYYKFYAVAGANVTTLVTRVDCGMDPSTYRYDGLYADTDDLGVGVFQDDNYADPCGSCFDDPLDVFVAPVTGWYTVGVSDFASCGEAPYEYLINVTGSTLAVGDCNTTVPGGQHNATTSMAQAIDNCLASAASSAQFVACVTALTNTWVSQGKITRAQKSKIITCAQGVPF